MDRKPVQRVDTGVFDMTKLPVNWSKVDDESIYKAADQLEGNIQQQIDQLEQLVKDNNIDSVEEKDGDSDRRRESKHDGTD
jgi:hypothetical protein